MSRHSALLLLVLATQLVEPVGAVRNERRCGSVDIRNNPKSAFQPKQYTRSWMRYKECTILEGDFTISMITQPNVTEAMFPVFENLREITGSILVFQIRGLRSLGKMFPRLRVIGGHSLIMNYALVIYQNYDLREVGLTRLQVIKNGGVRITENPRLCYTRSINWARILAGHIRDVLLDQLAGQCKNDCDVEDERDCLREPATGRLACWNATHCQTACEGVTESTSGCTDRGEPCHPLCMGGCAVANDAGACHTCSHTDVEGVCVAQCPAEMYEQLGRRCLTKAECHSLYPVLAAPGRNDKSAWKAFRGQCHYDCPADFQEDPLDPHNCVQCPGHCPKKCLGDTVDSIGSAMKFSKCNVIDGSLELDMRIGMESAGADKFAEAFGEIEEITGYLLIRFSSAFMSLHMFTKLRLIHGQQLWKNAYALVVFENQNLHQLFNMDRQRLRILRGKVNFQNNRMLCYKKIEAFVEQLGIRADITENDVSPYSNGDKAICDELTLEVKIVSVYNYGFVVSWVPFNTSDIDHRKFLGYQIFYKRVEREDPDMTIDDDRSACSDSWNMLFVTETGDDGDGDEAALLSGQAGGGQDATPVKGELVNANVESNTLYAVYVQTRLVNHPGARNAISKIHFVRTLFFFPDSPRMRLSHALGPDKLRLSWDPPLDAHGLITHYTVTWTLATDYPSATLADVCLKRVAPPKSGGGGQSSSSVSLISQITADAKDTCSRREGCCKCEATPPDDSSAKSSSGAGGDQRASQLGDRRGESATFEDSLQNRVFVQNCDANPDPERCPELATEEPPHEHSSEAKRHRRHSAAASLEAQLARLERAVARKSVPTQQQQRERERRSAVWRRVEDAQGEGDSPSSAVPRSSTTTGTGETTAPPRERVTATTAVEAVDVSAFDDADGNASAALGSSGGPAFNHTYGRLNVTGTSLVLTGLPHFAEYHVTVYACQDETAIEHYCSVRPAWTAIRTEPIPDYDMVDAATVTVYELNSTHGAGGGGDGDAKLKDAAGKWKWKPKPNDRRIYWQPPANPNGFILAYRAWLIKEGSNPLEGCSSYKDFEANGGIVFLGIPDGTYTLEVRVETSTLLLNNATVIPNLLTLHTPGFFTPMVIVLIGCSVFALLGILAALVYYYTQHMFGKKLEDYCRQTISANPDYLSQLEIYKADEWELRREDLELGEEIGRGTFGTVLRGWGKHIKSRMGDTFGECAVKTVPENSSNAERLHFLIEASVMKQFNTPHIVKLYGVVSDGQPVLVVMEMMAQGNLRDFLRSHRPNAEENKQGRAVPTLLQYFTWAAQIADGMSYLESMKFCHRDLAARNCMVHHDESVKIGDFGMARDIYYHEYYKPAGKRLMPVRWMAPESLKDGKFTMKSDIWSFGIVLYEMLTLGQQPYAGLGNDQVFNYIGVQRHVLRKPTECPDYWYKLMRLCWRYDPRERPSFHQVVRHLAEHSSDDFRRASFVLNDPRMAGGEQAGMFDFDIDLTDEQLHDQHNVYNDEFVYGLDGEEADDEDFVEEEIGDAASLDNGDDELDDEQQEDDARAGSTPVCGNVRRAKQPGGASAGGLVAPDARDAHQRMIGGGGGGRSASSTDLCADAPG